jgi:GNAT superfamily N-acetyltransferase
VLAYAGDTPVGWCSIAPRETHQAILASRVIPAIPAAPSEDGAVWSLTCFFIAPSARGSGLLLPLLEAACDYAAGQGAAVAEAYPWPGGASYRYMGTRDLYLSAGFHDAGPPAAAGQRPVMRREL